MTKTECLDKAKAIVEGKREYGKAENSFGRIAELWSVYLQQLIKPEDAAVMMALLKIARIQTGSYKEDSFIDACGYIACASELENI